MNFTNRLNWVSCREHSGVLRSIIHGDGVVLYVLYVRGESGREVRRVGCPVGFWVVGAPQRTNPHADRGGGAVIHDVLLILHICVLLS